MVRGDGSLDKGISNGYIFKVKLIGFDDKFDVRSKRKEVLRIILKFIRKMGLLFYVDEEIESSVLDLWS